MKALFFGSKYSRKPEPLFKVKTQSAAARLMRECYPNCPDITVISRAEFEDLSRGNPDFYKPEYLEG